MNIKPTVYSKKTLAEKLGILHAKRIYMSHASDHFLERLSPTVHESIERGTPNGVYDFIGLFAQEMGLLEREFPQLKPHLSPDGAFWVCWPKQSAKLETDVNENIIRDIGLTNGLVDVKVIAVDETWSGLKFVYRLKDRNKS